MTTTPDALPPLSQRLRELTAPQHERMHALMEAGRPFASRENYLGFLTAQYAFQRDVEHLFTQARLATLVPDLAQRGRLPAVAADLSDLGTQAPDGAPVTDGIDAAHGLGWLYVSEGSTLGAAFLLKAAERLGLSEQFGARHLAAYPDGRAVVWRRFVSALDSQALTPADGEAVIAGANAAFDRFGGLLQRHLPASAETA